MQNYQNHPLAGARDLDSAMALLWDFYKKYFVGLYVISIISALISNLISSTIDTTALMQASTDPELAFAALKNMALPYAGLLLFSLVFTIFLHAWVLGKPVIEGYGIAEALKDSAVVLFPYILTIIILGFGGIILISIGMLMLVLPGIFAMFYFITVIIFALPIALAESRSIATIIGKSFRYAHRNFWPNMAWVIVVALIMVIVSLVISGIVMLPFTGTFIKTLANPEAAPALLEMVKNPIYIILSSLTSALVLPVFPILAFILYFRNREDATQIITRPEDEDRVTVDDLYPRMPEKD